MFNIYLIVSLSSNCIYNLKENFCLHRLCFPVFLALHIHNTHIVIPKNAILAILVRSFLICQVANPLHLPMTLALIHNPRK